MTKKDIVMKISEETNIKQIDVKAVVQGTLDHIVAALAGGETVELRNFGVFKVKSRRSRIGRNPKTGELVDVQPKKLPYFKVGKELKEMIWKD